MKDPSSEQPVVRELWVVWHQAHPLLGIKGRPVKATGSKAQAAGRGAVSVGARKGMQTAVCFEECIPVAVWVLGPLWTVGPCYSTQSG